MHIRIAASAGFCPGVRRAAETVEKLLHQASPNRKIYTLGRLIHNDTYIEKLTSMGCGIIRRDEVEDILARAAAGENITVVIRAHGEICSVLEKLQACAAAYPNFSVVDCTCPYVERVRKIAAQHSGEDKLFFLLGAADHPEVEGIMSCLRGEGVVIPNAEALRLWISTNDPVQNSEKKVSMAAQTTQKCSEWKKSREILKKVYTNADFFDTICIVTENRQKEAAALAKEADLMVVIGSPDSSNSRKLVEVCREHCPHVLFVGSADSLRDIPMPAPFHQVAITAGASTPDSVIQEVYETMNEHENFAELLEASIKTLNTGDIVEGVVIAVSNNEIHLDLGSKATGVLTHDKATDDPSAKLEDLYKIGDIVKAKVVKVSDIDGLATLDKTRVDAESNWVAIVAAHESGEILEGKIVEVVKGGVIISLNSVRVFIPASQTGVPKDGDLTTLMNTVQRVKIIEIKTDRKRAYASIRAVQREERKAKEEAFWATIEEGKEYEGEVKNMTTFGAFVDLGGVDGMVHTSELSWRRVRHPSEVVSIGDKLRVYVKSFDAEKGRISLGYKTDEMNPWNIFTSQYQEGDVADVRIVSLMPFGAFAEIIPGCDGLIHISQIADHKIAKPDEVLEVGQTVTAKITAIDTENHKVSLSIRALLEEAAAEEEYTEDEEVIEEAAEEVADAE